MTILEYKNIKPTYYYSISEEHFNHFSKIASYINNSQYKRIKCKENSRYKAKNKLVSYLSRSLKSSSEALINRIVNTIDSSVLEEKKL